jgi:protein TonB
MRFQNQGEPMASAHLPNVSWLLLAFVVLSTLAHGLSLLLPTDHEVQLANHRLGATLISTVLLPAKTQPAKLPAPLTAPSAQTKHAPQPAPAIETTKQSTISTMSVASNTEIKSNPATSIEAIAKTKIEPIRPQAASETPRQVEPVTIATTSTDDTAQPSIEQLARQQKEQQEKQRNYLLGELQSQLNRYLSYPLLARRRGWQGEVMVAFDINVIGQLHNVRLTHSSGFSVLDHSAVTAINKLQQISLPDTLGRLQAMELQLPVRYQLHEG